MLDREYAPVGGAYEEPRELTKCRVVERLRRPDGLADDLEARRLHLRHRLSDVVDDERDHDVGAVGQPNVAMLLRVHPDEIAAMCGQALEGDRLALTCSLEPDHVAEERRHCVHVVRAQTDVADSSDVHSPTLLPPLAACEPDAFRAGITGVRECAGRSLEPEALHPPAIAHMITWSRGRSQMQSRGARVLGPSDGRAGLLGSMGVRFMLAGDETGGGFSLVEHPIPPRALAAPLHRHSREDEYSFVLEGQLGALLGDEVVYGHPGDLIFKPRGQWHAFWNAGDEPARILEMISPAGFERYFEQMVELLEQSVGAPDPRELGAIAAEHGLEVDRESIPRLTEQYGLRWGPSPDS